MCAWGISPSGYIDSTWLFALWPERMIADGKRKKTKNLSLQRGEGASANNASRGILCQDLTVLVVLMVVWVALKPPDAREIASRSVPSCNPSIGTQRWS